MSDQVYVSGLTGETTVDEYGDTWDKEVPIDEASTGEVDHVGMVIDLAKIPKGVTALKVYLS